MNQCPCPWCHPRPAPPRPERDALPELDRWCPECGGTHGYHYPRCSRREEAPRWVRP